MIKKLNNKKILLKITSNYKVIAAEGEQRAAKALKGAADIIASSSCAIQLRYLQTLNSIAAEKNSTIIFPVPMDLVEVFTGQGGKKNCIGNNQRKQSTQID